MHPLETADTFAAPYRHRASETAQSRHRNDASDAPRGPFPAHWDKERRLIETIESCEREHLHEGNERRAEDLLWIIERCQEELAELRAGAQA
jgi:hypothetical protein